jgi:hypothetical protein
VGTPVLRIGFVVCAQRACSMRRLLDGSSSWGAPTLLSGSPLYLGMNNVYGLANSPPTDADGLTTFEYIAFMDGLTG